jgi:hypothetical protein
MTWWISNFRNVLLLIAVFFMTSCEQLTFNDDGDEYGHTTISFSAAPVETRASTNLGAYFTKLNVQLFNDDGEKVFATTKTQTSSDANFGNMKINLLPGSYTVVAVGHSSTKSATIKSPTVCQFTASDGEKLTDTFCCCQEITITEDPQQFSLQMYRATAMVRFMFTDENIPESLARWSFTYTGGSANFSPTTMQGITRSSQSELRAAVQSQQYSIFTFPYMADSCSLSISVAATTLDGLVVRSRTFDDVPAIRNRITTYTGTFFEPGDGNITISDFGFVVNGDWDDEDVIEF